MDAIDALGSGSVQSGAKDGFSALGSQEFMKIILTELNKQDPLKPNDSSALLQQLSMIRSIQSDVDLTSKLQSLVGQNEMSAAAGLIGRVVSGVSEDGARVNGRVASVNRTSTGAVLTLTGGQRVPMKNTDQIIADPSGSAEATP